MGEKAVRVSVEFLALGGLCYQPDYGKCLFAVLTALLALQHIDGTSSGYQTSLQMLVHLMNPTKNKQFYFGYKLCRSWIFLFIFFAHKYLIYSELNPSRRC